MLQAQLRCLTPRDLVSGERRQVATTVRVKCTVTDRGRIINLKQVKFFMSLAANYKRSNDIASLVISV